MDNIKESAAVKKDYLNQYQECQKGLKRIEETVYELRSFKTLPAMFIDDMPHSKEHKDLSDYVVKLDELISRYYKLRYQRIKIFENIIHKIENYEEETERQLLYERYIKGCKWEDISDNMGYSIQHIHRIHNKAIKNFKM